MALAPLQSRQAAANARGAPSFASSSRFSQSRASVAAACPYSSLLAQKKQQTLSSFSSPIRGGSLIAMSAGELVCWSRKGRAFANRERRERISCCTDRGRSIFFLLPTSSSSSSPLLVLSKKKKNFSSRSPLLPLRRHHRRQGHSRHHPRRDRRRGQGARRSHGREGSGPGRRARRRPGRLGDVRAVESEGLRGGRDRVVRVLPARGRLAGGAAQGEREREYWGEREREHVLSLLLGGEKEEEERERTKRKALFIFPPAPPRRETVFPFLFHFALWEDMLKCENEQRIGALGKKNGSLFFLRGGARAREHPTTKKEKKT